MTGAGKKGRRRTEGKKGRNEPGDGHDEKQAERRKRPAKHRGTARRNKGGKQREEADLALRTAEAVRFAETPESLRFHVPRVS